jgi:maltose alpha-D-glucosyltransferase/alpha-amylase
MSPTRPTPAAAGDPLWYKDAVIYQLHVRSFHDADGDGVGDFKGLTEKLDYLQELGVTAVWLLPFYPSPLRDDGYDIADYGSVHPDYGDLRAFKRFLGEAHRRGLKVITELVINHTSDQHPWFQRARRAKPGSRARNFYVWSDTPELYRDARVIFKDFEPSNWSWDPVAGAYYWHRFYHHQPDLNFEEPAVRKAVIQAMDFWLEAGVDGMRLDAVPYLFEADGTNCENLPPTHAFLKELRAHVDATFDGRMLLAEANQWPEDAIAYFGDGDECHMAFHFPVMPRLFMALRQEDRFPVIDILEQTPPIPESCQWATFLRNHDELTLEMVTDEDRDYMYRVYAGDPKARINLGIRRRLAPLLGNDRRRVELMNALLFSLPGAPVLYYGDEIGMGDNFYLGDRNGVRTPMQWSSDRNAGFSRANPQRLFLPVIVDPEYHFEAINVAAQEANPHSLLWWTRRLIALRKRYPAFSRGDVSFLLPRNHRVLAFVRRHGDERVLVVANLSRFVQHVELDMKGADESYVGTTPVELFGRNPFPPIGEWPYLLTLGPHGFYWFSLESGRQERARQRPVGRAGEHEPPAVRAAAGGDWDGLLAGAGRRRLEAALPQALSGRRWFGGKARTVQAMEVVEVLPVLDEGRGVDVRLVLVRVAYTEGEAETYALPLARAAGAEAARIERDQPRAVVVRLEPAGGGEAGAVLYDASIDPAFARALVAGIARNRRFRNGDLHLAAVRTAAFAGLAGGRGADDLEPRLSRAEQSNTSVIFGETFILKLFRKLEPGINPDLELGRFLTDRARFAHTPPVAGALELRRERGEPLTLGILQGFVANEGDAWRFTLDALGRFFERVSARRDDGRGVAAPSWPGSEPRPLERVGSEPPQEVRELLGLYPERARLLGERTAELHLALGGDEAAAAGAELAPEPFSTLYQRSLYQSMRALSVRRLQLLEQSRAELAEPAAEHAERLLAARDRLLERFSALRGAKLDAGRIRIHGDFHLGQVLWTGRDFQIIDFEGEPARPLSERRIKRSPLRDVAGMLRSFHYAAYTALAEASGSGNAPEPEVGEGWARAWTLWISAAFLGAYLDRAAGWPVLPASRERLGALLDVFVLDKALYELGYELNNRPDWVDIPLRGILALLEAA